MSQPSSNDQSFTSVVDQQLFDDNGDVIGTREFVVEEGLAASADDGLVQVFSLLTPEEIAELVANRVCIEQAKGMLMLVYGIDAERAFELLKWRSQTTNVKLGSLARQLIDEFCTLTDEQRLPTREGYDFVLLTAHERITAEPA